LRCHRLVRRVANLADDLAAFDPEEPLTGELVNGRWEGMSTSRRRAAEGPDS
jgi:hypothetical protein